MDVLEGMVLEVLDGDTFDLDVDTVDASGNYGYNDVERVRLADIDAPELRAPGGRAAHARLRTRLQGRRARVMVQARDRYGRIIGHVRVVR